MPSTGFTLCGTGANEALSGSSSTWSNPGNITTDGGSQAQASLNDFEYSDWLVASNFGFSIPAGATIDGIEVRTNKDSGPANRHVDQGLYIYDTSAGNLSASDQGDGSTWWPGTPADVDQGGASDLMGTSGLSASDINASTFGYKIAALKNTSSGGGTTANVYDMWMNIHYTEAAASNDATVKATLPSLTGAFSADVDTDASVSATLPSFAASLSVGVEATASFASTLPIPTAAFNVGHAEIDASLGATLPALTGSFSGGVEVDTSLAGVLPALTASLEVEVSVSATVRGELPSLSAAFVASRVVDAEASFASILPALAANVNVETGVVAIEPTQARGGGWDRKKAEREREFRESLEKRLRDAYEEIVEGKAPPRVKRSVKKAFKKAGVKAKTPLPPVSTVDFEALAADIAAARMIIRAYERMIEEEDIEILLLAA